MTSCQSSSLSLVLWKINEWKLRSVAKEERTVIHLLSPLNVLSEYYMSYWSYWPFFFFFQLPPCWCMTFTGCHLTEIRF